MAQTTPVEDIKTHYRVAYYYTFLDHTISRLKTRLHQNCKVHFLPSICCLPTPPSCQKIYVKIKSEFDAFLPQPSSFDNEITIWKLHMKARPDTDTKTNLLSVCKFALENQLFYPNIHSILLLFSCVFLCDLVVVSSPSVPFGMLRPGAVAQ